METSSTADHLGARRGVVDAADVLGVDAVRHQLLLTGRTGVFDQCRPAPTPPALIDGGRTSAAGISYPSSRCPLALHPAAPQPRVEHLVQAGLQQQQARTTMSVSITVGGTKAHQAPVRTEPHAIAQ